MVTTTQLSSTDIADARRWALRQLNRPQQDDAFDAAAALRWITEAEYIVGGEQITSVCVLANPARVSSVTAERGRHLRLFEEVSAFANQFFELEPDQRRERWQTLNEECQVWTELRGWLKLLAVGLELKPIPPSGDAQFDTLVRAGREVFISRPPLQMRLRQDYQAMFFEDAKVWAAVAKKLQSRQPSFVKLAAPWIYDLNNLKPVPSPVLAKPKSRVTQAVAEWDVQRPTKQKSEGRWGWIVFAVVMVFVRVVSMANRHTTNYQPSQTPFPVNQSPFPIQQNQPSNGQGLFPNGQVPVPNGRQPFPAGQGQQFPRNQNQPRNFNQPQPGNRPNMPGGRPSIPSAPNIGPGGRR